MVECRDSLGNFADHIAIMPQKERSSLTQRSWYMPHDLSIFPTAPPQQNGSSSLLTGRTSPMIGVHMV